MKVAEEKKNRDEIVPVLFKWHGKIFVLPCLPNYRWAYIRFLVFESLIYVLTGNFCRTLQLINFAGQYYDCLYLTDVCQILYILYSAFRSLFSSGGPGRYSPYRKGRPTRYLHARYFDKQTRHGVHVAVRNRGRRSKKVLRQPGIKDTP